MAYVDRDIIYGFFSRKKNHVIFLEFSVKNSGRNFEKERGSRYLGYEMMIKYHHSIIDEEFETDWSSLEPVFPKKYLDLMGDTVSGIDEYMIFFCMIFVVWCDEYVFFFCLKHLSNVSDDIFYTFIAIQTNLKFPLKKLKTSEKTVI